MSKTIVKELKPYWVKLASEKYYSHLYFEGDKPILPLYTYTKAATPTNQHRLVVEREMKEFTTEEEMIDYIEKHPDLTEADPEAWEQYPYIPAHLKNWVAADEALSNGNVPDRQESLDAK